MKPNFMIIGAARSGTTSLFQYLDHHPDIVMSPVKELNFFSNEKYWKKGLDWYEGRFPKIKHKGCAVGEASTSYTQLPFSPPVAERIYEYNPDIKLVYMVRDPIQRFVSHYMQRVKAGHETRDFGDIFKNIEKEAFAWQGRYFFQISSYLKLFDFSQIKIISFDDIVSDADSTVRSLFDFIGVDSEINIDGIGEVHNASSTVIKKNRIGLGVIDFYHEYVEQKNIPYRLKKMFIDMANVGGSAVEKPKLSKEQRQMLADFYRADSKALQTELDVPTDHWF